MVDIHPPITLLTLDAVLASAISIAARDASALDRDQEWQLRLWSLQNEVDVVQARASAMIGGDTDAHDAAKLATVQALLRVAARAALWVQALEGGFPPSVAAAESAGGEDRA